MSTFSVLSNTLSFLSLQMVQNKHKGVALQAFFLFFLTKYPCQLKRAFFTKECITHFIPKRALYQLSQNSCFCAVKEDELNYFFSFAHIASIWYPSSPFELIQCHYPTYAASHAKSQPLMVPKDFKQYYRETPTFYHMKKEEWNNLTEKIHSSHSAKPYYPIYSY